MRKYFLLILILVSGSAFCQKEASKWYFGYNVAFDFSTSPPTQLSNSAMATVEGCASISDNNGNLLFYTDGATVWDQTHNVMSNGSGLLGNGFSYTSQAAIIIKKPGSINLYYIFTLDDGGGPNGLMYSIVDMSQAGGLGAVINKNISLHTPSSEKLTAVNHCNGTDVWVISHDLTGGDFRSFLVSPSGISSNPVISSFPNLSSIYLLGAMKASPDGNKIILAALTNSNSPATGGFEIYDFDNSTGAVSNRQNLFNTHNAYGCEFSSDSKKVYGTYNLIQSSPTPAILYYLVQWDLCVLSPSDIATSQTTLNGTGSKLLPQLAPDGKIYIAGSGPASNSVSVIHSPNNAGTFCNFTDISMGITAGTVQAGLPNFKSSFFHTHFKGNISAAAISTLCMAYQFSASDCGEDLSKIVNAQWNFGDPGSGPSNTSTVINASHQFSSPGTYTVQIIKNYNCFTDTVKKVIQVAAAFPTLSVTGNTTVCAGNSTTLSATGADSYSWTSGPGTQSQVVVPLTTTIYTVTGTYSATGCSSTHTLLVNASPCVGVGDLPQSLKNIAIYPNPAKDFFFADVSGYSSLEIFDVFGRALYRTEIKNKTRIDLKQFSNGVYLIKVIDENNGLRLFQLIVE